MTWSIKAEIKILIWMFIVILLLPFLSVLVVMNIGTNAISNTLVNSNNTTHQVTIHTPKGEVISKQTTRTWPVQGVVTLEFGMSDLPYQPLHTGIDIADKTGIPITPFMKGNVIDIEHLSWGYGNYVIVNHGNNITSLYGHMIKTNTVIGQEVSPGDIIGYEGQTGWATGPHLHFEIRIFGIPVNPRTFIEGNP